jgi:Fe-S oxidoreductase
LTTCPHCYNIFKNEYPDLGGNYELINYVQFLEKNVVEGKLNISASILKDARITYHDPCYLGRANNIYKEPRTLLKSLTNNLTEMERNRSFALCCGAGGAQMFKEAEAGKKEVFMERTEDAFKTGAEIIATACPFCMTMLTDGLKYKNKEDAVKNYDIAELIAQALDL